jgi:hypothetical protein
MDYNVDSIKKTQRNHKLSTDSISISCEIYSSAPNKPIYDPSRVPNKEKDKYLSPKIPDAQKVATATSCHVKDASYGSCYL